MKFFLNISKEEQRKRFLSRIDKPSKNWKFSEADVKERYYWDEYMNAYQDMVNSTATPHAPWYVIPADDKMNMRLIVTQLILKVMRGMDMHYPEVDDTRRAELQLIRKGLEVKS
jgi:polyphosphate kinase 2 (PPK2 family)